MNFPNVTISLSFTTPAQDAPALLQKLLAALPPDAITTPGSQGQVGQSWPPIPATVGDAYRKVAEENLRQLRDGTILTCGWDTVKDLSGAIDSLRPETRKVVLRAIHNGGHITREEVYELLGRNTTQSLKGFTKPAASLTEKLKSGGELPDDAKPLLEPIYKESKTYQQAQGFAVPVQVVSLMTQRTALAS